MASKAGDSVCSESCKRCKKKVINGIKCQNCSNYFHLSCAKLYNNMKPVDDKSAIICCESEKVSGVESDIAFFDAIDGLNNSENKVDNVIFSYIIKQKDLIISELRDKINILNNQIELMKEYSHRKTDNIQKSIEIEGKIRNEQKITKTAATEANPNNAKSTSGNVNKVFSKITNKQISADVHEIQTKLKCDEIINLAKDDASLPQFNGSKDTRSEWQKVTHNKRKRIFGNNKEAPIKGVPKLTALHVYRLNIDTTADALKNMLMKTFPEVTCESLDSKYPDLYTSFKVNIHQENFRKAMDPEVGRRVRVLTGFFT